MKDYRLSEIKKICENRFNGITACYYCPFGISICTQIFGSVFPSEWDIDFEYDTDCHDNRCNAESTAN